MDKENSVQTDNKVEQPTHLVDTTHYDVIIVGGGMIGASMALALSTVQSHQDDQFQGDQALSIAMVDAVAFQQSPSPSFDDRSVALSYGSKKIFETLGIWSQLSSVSEPIEHIHVSDKGHMGMCRLHAEDYEQEALGYVVENRALGQVLHQQLTQRGIDIIAPAEVVALDHKQHSQNTKLSIITLKQQQQRVQLSSPLIIAADGAQSPMATRLNIAKQRFDYPQMAAICNIKTSQLLSGWAFERFTDTGPLALLPLSKNRYSVVWTFSAEQRQSMESMDDECFKAALQQRFGYRAGIIEQVGKRIIYPLSLQKLQRGYRHNTVFIGNALHSGHPVAGQGFNLGLRDVAQLAETIALARHYNLPLADQTLLEYFWRQRQKDIDETLAITDALAHLFANRNRLLVLARNLSLKWLDIIKPAKHRFAEKAMGLRNDMPMLARGLALSNIHKMPVPEVLNSLITQSQLSSLNQDHKKESCLGA
ncbi:2-octaprenyl-6-methoxyphenyl hydroxylase [Pleionea mediterranea]|uniref:2-octaprenyl-6-methoxyphenol hydroxylase /2-octaprenyl-3-methyl-6-methoxy-1,4-benzoquinol hydroxylase n=1 Tax=Pleionea mediterranea TaxID=523701 RepID=A0A316G1F8_9GAMM|nr:2-octaprenyl-6-methoxyphenyl hydroxylase [Pleionea mediterranea]PWK53736.1 2-octaprenyl-6-methoxyphenol hydroxylase /2-octaprenyl-3-methyl-6-methoxy-1,4-benzoquinol hydroxylase [Pleionea mediterranea]